ncbi:MAG: hypothetical protein ACM3YO_07605 [Bacteroidota bacterium]
MLFRFFWFFLLGFLFFRVDGGEDFEHLLAEEAEEAPLFKLAAVEDDRLGSEVEFDLQHRFLHGGSGVAANLQWKPLFARELYH